MPNQFSPRSSSKPLKPRDLRRIQRNTAPVATRIALLNVDRQELERRQRVEKFWLDVAAYCVFGGIGLCLIALILRG